MNININKIQISSIESSNSSEIKCYKSSEFADLTNNDLINNFIIKHKSEFCLYINQTIDLKLINKLIFSPFYYKINNKIILFIDKNLNNKKVDQIKTHLNELGFQNNLIFLVDIKKAYIVGNSSFKEISNFKNDFDLIYNLALSNFTIFGSAEQLSIQHNNIEKLLKENTDILPFAEKLASLNYKNMQLEKALSFINTDLNNSKTNLEIQTKNLQKEIEWYKAEIEKIKSWGHSEINKTKEYYENKFEKLPFWFVKIGNILFTKKSRTKS